MTPVDSKLLPNTQPLPGLALRRSALAGLLAALVCLFLLSLAVGSVNMPLSDILTILMGGEPTKAVWTTIVLDFRLPKALAAILAGAALAVGGLQMQTLFRNPLAGPFVLGINSGASLGVAIVVLTAGTVGSAAILSALVSNSFGLAFAAIIGAGIVMGLVLLVAQRVQNSITLLILGLMFGYATNAVVSLLMYFSISERVQAYINWTFGSFGGVTWTQMRVFGPAVIIGLVIGFVVAKPLNALLLGEAYARSMGLNVARAGFCLVL